jgi:protein-disulfide isomerase
MRKLLLRMSTASALVALAGSMASLVDGSRLAPAFCGLDSGCAQLQQRAGVILFGLPALPLFGVIWFSLLFVVTRHAPSRARVMWGVCALMACALIASQQLLFNTWCSLCLVVNGFALAGAAAYFYYEPIERAASPAFSVLALLLAFSPVAALWLPDTLPYPPVLKALASADKPTVFVFSDFECAYCRETHPVLTRALQQFESQFSVRRVLFPLPQHPHAQAAAVAFICAEQQDKGELAAHALFAAPSLEKRDIDAALQSAGVDDFAHSRCVNSSLPQDRLAADALVVKASYYRGLPTVWIGDEVVLGAASFETYSELLQRAASVRTARLP